ncbi:hypothetical protein KHA90_20055 [Flavobacterium psychroterrae]|uniref:TonB-dependent receptor plug domain-containing protein n=1 Tax=Flavobacterium psychroterrae TaxID=2133767 RepID=A0ABS5PGC3_9FLAO|nr:hypothetical protein [Flavobacterium psychroterrae]MBS7233317.1 hypothetical protein [Flavobacterium psychroterrae]
MDNQDKIFDKFKEAAHNSESRDFPGMEKVWSRVEDKLDKKEDKKAISLWKKIAIAASFLLLISIASQFFKKDKILFQNQKVVIKENTEKPVLQKKDGLVFSDSPLFPKPDAIKILKNPIIQQNEVAANESAVSVAETGTGTADAMIIEEPVASVASNYAEENESSYSKDKAVENIDYSKTIERESAKVAFADRQSQAPKKSAPLVIINGSPISHKSDEKRDKMMQNELHNLQPENLDSLVILDQPLYIIDGIYYSENDLFGKNPTSPYAPLNKQEIKTITVLQDLEATSKYGEKGKKGVVIITTKNGKPADKN